MNRICNIYSESAYVFESLSSPIEKLRLEKFRDAICDAAMHDAHEREKSCSSEPEQGLYR